MLLRDEPRSVRQQLVERLQAAEFGGGVFQAAQPALLPPRLQEAGAVLLHQVGALVASCSLWSRFSDQLSNLIEERFATRPLTQHDSVLTGISNVFNTGEVGETHSNMTYKNKKLDRNSLSLYSFNKQTPKTRKTSSLTYNNPTYLRNYFFMLYTVVLCCIGCKGAAAARQTETSFPTCF